MNIVFKTELENATKDIFDALRTVGVPNSNKTVIAAYLLKKVSGYNNPFVDLETVLEDNVDELSLEEKRIARKLIGADGWKRVNELVMKYNHQIFDEISKNYQPKTWLGFERAGVSESIVNLVISILELKENDRVLDTFCNNGLFVSKIAQIEKKINVLGCDVNSDDLFIAKIRTLESDNVELKVTGFDKAVFHKNADFNKIFGNYPLGLKVKSLNDGAEKYIKKYPFITGGTSLGWLYNTILVNNLEVGGKLVAMMTNGCTWNNMDEKVRQYFIEKGLVEAVISLPAKMLSGTNIPVSLIVISSGNDAVKFVDATQVFKAGRRLNEFTEENIKTIMGAYNGITDIGILVSKDKIKENQYALAPERYIVNENLGYDVPVDDGIELGELVVVKRGAPLTASQLDELDTQAYSGFNYVRLADIKNGIINETLPMITHIDKKYQKYILEKDNIILSKNGYPFKVAIANPTENQKILPVGNMYVLEVDQLKVNPYYLKAFLESERGTTLLKSIVTGVAIPIINVEMLKKIKIVLPSLKKQNEIAKKYQIAQLKIEKIRGELEQATKALNQIIKDAL